MKIEYKGVDLCLVEENLKNAVVEVVKKEKENIRFEDRPKPIIVCLFCGKSNILGNKDGYLMKVPETYKGLPISLNKKPASYLRKLGVMVHKCCLEKVMNPRYQAWMMSKQHISG